MLALTLVYMKIEEAGNDVAHAAFFRTGSSTLRQQASINQLNLSLDYQQCASPWNNYIFTVRIRPQ